MTSNIGSGALMDLSLSEDKRIKAVQEALKAHFRPEFLNRIDEIVHFKTLSEEQIQGIVKIQLNEVCERLKAKKINLQIDDSAVQYLCKKGYDPHFGARPLKRVIQSDVLNNLARELIAGHFKAGDTVKVSASDMGIHIKK